MVHIHPPPNKSQDGRCPPSSKKLNCYICSTDFDEIWHSNTHWPTTGARPINFKFLKIQHGGIRHRENHQKIAISQQRFDRSSQNLAWCRIIGADFRFEAPGQSSVGLIGGGRGQWLGGTMASAVRGASPPLKLKAFWSLDVQRSRQI